MSAVDPGSKSLSLVSSTESLSFVFSKDKTFVGCGSSAAGSDTTSSCVLSVVSAGAVSSVGVFSVLSAGASEVSSFAGAADTDTFVSSFPSACAAASPETDSTSGTACVAITGWIQLTAIRRDNTKDNALVNFFFLRIYRSSFFLLKIMIPINIALNPEAAIQKAALDLSPVLTFPVVLFVSSFLIFLKPADGFFPLLPFR